MTIRPKPEMALRKIAPPAKGWRWLIDEKTKRGDWFFSGSKIPCLCARVKNDCDIGKDTEGPKIYDLGGGKYEVTGYIRRVTK